MIRINIYLFAEFTRVGNDTIQPLLRGSNNKKRQAFNKKWSSSAEKRLASSKYMSLNVRAAFACFQFRPQGGDMVDMHALLTRTFKFVHVKLISTRFLGFVCAVIAQQACSSKIRKIPAPFTLFQRKLGRIEKPVKHSLRGQAA